MTRALLLRHGETEANVKWIYCGATDVPLSDAGRAGLKALRAAGGYPDVSGWRVCTSGARRAEETLELLYGPVPHRLVPGLWEMNFGAFEMRAYEELKDDAAFLAWREGAADVPAPGGESGVMMRARVLAAFAALRAEGGDFLAVSHGGPIAAIMASLFPDEGRDRFAWQPANGCGWLVTFRGEKPAAWEAVPSAPAVPAE